MASSTPPAPLFYHLDETDLVTEVSRNAAPPPQPYQMRLLHRPTGVSVQLSFAASVTERAARGMLQQRLEWDLRELGHLVDPAVADPAPCLKCGRVLEPALPPPHSNWQPYGGTVFTSYGHYGSTVFDPPGGLTLSRRALHITICDPCLRAAAIEHPGVVRHVLTTPVADKRSVTPWCPEPLGEDEDEEEDETT